MRVNTLNNLNKIVIILGRGETRLWQVDLLERLTSAGHLIDIQHVDVPGRSRHTPDPILALESLRFGKCLATKVTPPASSQDPTAAKLVIDLSGRLGVASAPALRVTFEGQPDFADGLTQMLANKVQPVLTTTLDDQTVGVARPMLSDWLWLSRASDDVLSGAISLLEQSVARFFADALTPLEPPAPSFPVVGFWRHYLPSLTRAAATRALERLSTRRPFYWQVAYRTVQHAGIATTTVVDGPEFTTLADDGQRFYADPFVVEHKGEEFLFVEEYPYATGKGVISVAKIARDGQASVPRCVLEEPYHLSYPQVFRHDGETFMLPESGGARRLVLYRASSFPDHWVQDTILIADRDINDATLLHRDGQFWLFGTERRGAGSPSDTMVVFSAPTLRGPWSPHKLNPVVIDSAAARPGGAFIDCDGRTFLPVQNGQKTYGGGLGLMELLRVDDEAVVFAEPVPVQPGKAWHRKGIHTLNRTGSIEVIDSAG